MALLQTGTLRLGLTPGAPQVASIQNPWPRLQCQEPEFPGSWPGTDAGKPHPYTAKLSQPSNGSLWQGTKFPVTAPSKALKSNISQWLRRGVRDVLGQHIRKQKH